MLKQLLETRNSKLETAPDYFSVFELPHKLNIEEASLEREFYAQSRKLHPDRFAGKSMAEQERATEQSSLLNDAYRTLKDPIARTEHLLSLEGVNMEEQSRSATDSARASGEQKKQAVPPEMLEEVFEMNMQLQELKMAQQVGEEADPETRAGLEAARENFAAKLQASDQQLRQLWSKWDESTSDQSKLEARNALVDVLNKRNYVRNLVRDVSEALELE